VVLYLQLLVVMLVLVLTLARDGARRRRWEEHVVVEADGRALRLFEVCCRGAVQVQLCVRCVLIWRMPLEGGLCRPWLVVVKVGCFRGKNGACLLRGTIAMRR
jgi:hypothetical protein